MEKIKHKEFRPCAQRAIFQSAACPAAKMVCEACARCSIEEAQRIVNDHYGITHPNDKGEKL